MLYKLGTRQITNTAWIYQYCVRVYKAFDQAGGSYTSCRGFIGGDICWGPLLTQGQLPWWRSPITILGWDTIYIMGFRYHISGIPTGSMKGKCPLVIHKGRFIRPEHKMKERLVINPLSADQWLREGSLCNPPPTGSPFCKSFHSCDIFMEKILLIGV